MHIYLHAFSGLRTSKMRISGPNVATAGSARNGKRSIKIYMQHHIYMCMGVYSRLPSSAVLLERTNPCHPVTIDPYAVFHLLCQNGRILAILSRPILCCNSLQITFEWRRRSANAEVRNRLKENASSQKGGCVCMYMLCVSSQRNCVDTLFLLLFCFCFCFVFVFVLFLHASCIVRSCFLFFCLLSFVFVSLSLCLCLCVFVFVFVFVSLSFVFVSLP